MHAFTMRQAMISKDGICIIILMIEYTQQQ